MPKFFGMAHAGDLAKEVGAPILDRSRLRILLCDKDPITAEDEVHLLRKCSYQVTPVKTARQVVEVLNSCGSEVDLILAEVELPKEKGFKLLKHIVRQESLKRIPVVMMSRRDEMAIVVKCLRFGAADYLVKPLRTNELLNLWTHMWRRRRMLGLAEKHVIGGSLNTPLDLLVSDTSESNHNSTNLLSDDTDDRTHVTSADGASTLACHDLESEMAAWLELSLKPSMDLSSELVSRHCTTAGSMPSPPRKAELKVGQFSAFLAYTKAINQTSECSGNVQSTGYKVTDDTPKIREVPESSMVLPQEQTAVVPSTELSHAGPSIDWETVKTTSRSENGSGEVDNQDSINAGWNSSSVPHEPSGVKFPPAEQFSVTQACVYSEASSISSTIPSLHPQFVSGLVMNPSVHSSVFIPPYMHAYHGLPHDDTVNFTPGMPSMNALQPGHGLPPPPTFSYFPFGLHVAPPYLGAFTAWPSMPVTPIIDHKRGQTERREAALNKFMRKRKDRCFEKKIRYVSRKKLAEQRPRIRGQFVRRANQEEMNEIEVVDEYDDDEDGPGFIELAVNSSPESWAAEIANRSHCTR